MISKKWVRCINCDYEYYADTQGSRCPQCMSREYEYVRKKEVPEETLKILKPYMQDRWGPR